MRRHYISIAVAMLLCGSVLSTSCIGSFKATNKVMSWNRTIGNKFVNELVFVCFCILPVYELTVLADALVINSIEFWSGSNPVAQGTRMIEGENGRYLVDCDGKGYTITSETDGSVVRLDFNADERSWSATVGDKTLPLMTFTDDNHVNMPLVGGAGEINVELSQSGLMAYRTAALGYQFAVL